MIGNEKIIIEAVGGIHIGKSFIMSFQASKPFGKIELYEEQLVLRIQKTPEFILRLFRFGGRLGFVPGTYKHIPRMIELPYRSIQSFSETKLGRGGHGIRFIHNNPDYPPFLQFWAKTDKAIEITNYLRVRGIPGG